MTIQIKRKFIGYKSLKISQTVYIYKNEENYIMKNTGKDNLQISLVTHITEILNSFRFKTF